MKESCTRDGKFEMESKLKNLNLVRSGQTWANTVDKRVTDAKERLETFSPEYRETEYAGKG